MPRALLVSASLLLGTSAQAALLPYSIRTNPYSGSGTTVHGDIRTVGMAGATFGLGDTFIAATDNPAGLAMTLNQADLNATTNWSHDDRIQEFKNSVHTTNFGGALSTYPWAFSMGYRVPYREASQYELEPAALADPAALNVSIREFRMSIARVLFENQLSLGAGLILGQSETEFRPLGGFSPATANHDYAVGVNLGAMLQLPSRFLVGLAFQPSLMFGGDTARDLPGLSDFFQPILVPARMGAGLGWIPNRFFRADFSLLVMGATPGAAPLRDNSVMLGEALTIHPRFGGAYQFADFPELRATVFSGLYYEAVRVADAFDRLHFTIGVETKPWIFNLGWGLDVSAGYRNYLVTAGVDVFKVMQKLELIPKPHRPPYGEALPQFSHLSDTGLPRPLVRRWRQEGPALDPVKIGLELPMRIQDKALDVVEGAKDVMESAVETLRSRPDAKPSAPRRSQKRAAGAGGTSVAD